MKRLTVIILAVVFPCSAAFAADYRLMGPGAVYSEVVIRAADGLNIPPDAHNPDRIVFMSWLAAGNTPDPYVAPPAPVPQSVSAMQAKVALLNAGKLDAANAWVASQNAQVQLIWATATTFDRNSALMNSAAASLGWSQADLDALFTAAAAINP